MTGKKINYFNKLCTFTTSVNFAPTLQKVKQAYYISKFQRLDRIVDKPK